MNRLTLQRNVQFLYEEHLARVELRGFGCEQMDRDEDNPWEFLVDLNGNEAALIQRSAYLGAVDGRPTVYRDLITPAYQGGRFNRTRSVNQYLTHWIYPYRGKFHPQMVRALLNILGARPGDLVLDPFVGSGTTALEASLLGMNCVGVDLSPVCQRLTRVKSQAWQAVPAIRERVQELLKDWNLHPDDVEVQTGEDPRVADFMEVARLVTYSDEARRNREPQKYLRKNLGLMLESVQWQADAIAEFGLVVGDVRAELGDARDLAASGVEPESVDVVVTSPPYSIALDYVENDEHALLALDIEPDDLRAEMIGVRGRGSRMKMELYIEDMQQAFREVATALKPGGRAAFVIGDATVGGQEVATTSTMVDWAEQAGLPLVRNIPKIVHGLYNVMNDERILLFRKPDRP